MRANNLTNALISGLTLSRFTFQFFWLVVLFGILPAIASDTFSFTRLFSYPLLRNDIIRAPELLQCLAPILLLIGALSSSYYLRSGLWVPAVALAPYVVLAVSYYTKTSIEASYLVFPILEILSVFSLLLFLFYSSVASAAFVLFGIALVIGYFSGAPVDLLNILSFVCVALILQLAAIFYSDNIDIIRKVPRVSRGALCLEALKFAIPIIVAAVAVTLVSNLLISPLINKWTAELLVDPSVASSSEDDRLTSEQLQRDIHATIASEIQKGHASTIKGINEARTTSKNQTTAFAQQAKKTVDTAMPTSMFSIPGCSWRRPKCYARRKAMQAAESAYQNIRGSVVRSIHGYVDGTKSAGDTLTDDAHKKLMERVDSDFEKMKKTLDGAVDAIFLAMGVLGLLSALLLAAALLKGFFIILARVAFERGALPYISLTPFGKDERGPASSQVFEESYELRISKGAKWYGNRRATVRGAFEYGVYYHPADAPLARILSSIYYLDEITERSAPTGKITLPEGRDYEYVEWTIPKGKSIVVNPRELVLISDGVTMTSIFSARLTTLLFGRWRFFLVNAPVESSGVVVLKINGNLSVGGRRTGNEAFDPSELTTWQKSSKFIPRGRHNFRGIYFNNVSLIGIPGAPFALTSEPIWRARGPLGHLLRQFANPFF